MAEYRGFDPDHNPFDISQDKGYEIDVDQSVALDKSEPGSSKRLSRSRRSNRKPRKVRRCSRRTTS